MKKQKTRTKQYIDKNPIESILGIGGGTVKSVTSDVIRGTGTDVWNQFLGQSLEQKSRLEAKGADEALNQTVQGEGASLPAGGRGDLTEGEELVLADHSSQQEKTNEKLKSLGIEPGEVAVEYRREMLHGALRSEQRKDREIETKIQEIIVELKRLIATSKELQIEFKEVVVAPRITKPGKYHVNFFEWVLSTIRLARTKVEDSKAWLAAMKGKHAKKGYYWTMSQESKGGTSFSLSSERVVATQTG